ncbi:tyrosine-type recombinase/integrase [Kamptonema cortianum]|nr:tyrosine-type recombinase/integrase [Kamptonema cortianum]
MGKRRLNGEATIQETGGRFRAAIQIDGKRIWGPRVDRRADAVPALKRKLGDKYLLGGTPKTVLRCILRTVDSQVASGEIKTTTAELKRTLIRKHIEPDQIARIPIHAITSDNLQRFIDGINLSPHSKRNIAGIITTALRANGITLSYKSRKPLSKKARILTPQEREKSIRFAVGEERWLIGFMLQMGLRRGEALGVMHEDRDADGIMLQVVRIKGVLLVTTLKTRQSEAWVPLPRWMRRYLGKGEGFILNDNGRPRHPGWANRTVAQIADRAGIGRITPHDLRRTAAMGLLESGVDIRTAAEILRHDPAVLATIYAKSRRDLKREAMQAWQQKKCGQKCSQRLNELVQHGGITLVSGTSSRKGVKVRVLSWAPRFN